MFYQLELGLLHSSLASTCTIELLQGTGGYVTRVKG